MSVEDAVYLVRELSKHVCGSEWPLYLFCCECDAAPAQARFPPTATLFASREPSLPSPEPVISRHRNRCQEESRPAP